MLKMGHLRRKILDLLKAVDGRWGWASRDGALLGIPSNLQVIDGGETNSS